jgi:hypothetical protein
VYALHSSKEQARGVAMPHGIIQYYCCHITATILLLPYYYCHITTISRVPLLLMQTTIIQKQKFHQRSQNKWKQ